MSDKLAEKKETSLRGLIESDAFKTQVAKALPKHLTPDRFIRIACTAMLKTPALMDCTQASVFNALLSLSQLGLEPDGRRAHLIPYGNVCQLIVDYKGLVELAMRSGNVANIHADVVCENDEFVYDRGQITKHAINFREKRGNVFAAYATVRFKDGTEKTEVMSKDEIEAIHGRSKAGKSGPWITDWNEMAKKTVFRRLSKWITLSPEYHDILEKDFDSFEGLNQPSAKGMIPPPPLKKQPEQKFDEVVTITAEPEPEPEKQNQGNPALDAEPPDNFKLASEEPDDNSLDGLKAKIRKAAAQAFPNENSFALWLKTATTSEDGKYKGYDTLSFCKSIGSAKVIYGKLQKLVEDKKKKDA
jgi:recombination protein RecT